MSFDISFYTEKDRAEWERFVRHSSQGNFFHFQRFLDYHPEGRFNMRHLIFRRKGHIVAIWPGAYRDEDGLKSWTSHPGASYGGLITLPNMGIRDIHQLVLSLIEVAKEEGIERLRCTPPPLMYHRRPEDTVEFAMLRAGFTYLKQDYTQAVDLVSLPKEEEEIMLKYDAKTRTAIRKAVKSGLEVKHDVPIEGQELDDYYSILYNNRKRLGVTPTHTRDEIARLVELAPRYLDLSMAYYEDKPVAGILNFICNEKVILEFYIAHKNSAQKLRPVPLLVHETILRSQRRGFQWMDFGISTEAEHKVTWGLAAFKENFFVQGFFRNTLILDTIQSWEPSETFLPTTQRVMTDMR